MLRLATAMLAIPLAIACNRTGSGDDNISDAETAATTAAVESTVVALSPVTSTDPQQIVAAYTSQYTQDLALASCATVETDNRTFVKVTFACTGPLQTTGTLELAITSLSTVEATAALTIGAVAIDGSLVLTVPASAAEPRTLEGSLVIAGPRRELEADASAEWLVSGNCVTFSASGTVAVGEASKGFAITNRTACRE
jgi:hypothetical protein